MRELPIYQGKQPTTWLSKPNKLNCKSWGLEAQETCPGSRDLNGELLPICSICYATDGNYLYPSVRKRRAFNRLDWKSDGWENRMITILKHETKLRWFDSGDLYHPMLAEKIYNIMVATPHVKHWINTKSYMKANIARWIDKMASLPNVAMRRSSQSLYGGFIPGYHGATQLSKDMPVPKGVFRCPSMDQGNQCQDCTACFDKRRKVIGYVIH